MKVFILFNLLAAASLVFADETLPFLKAGNEVYTNVTVFNVTATDVYFTYASGKGMGMANAKLKDLDPAMQKHFHYNAASALAVEQKQSEANAQYHSQMAGQSAPSAVQGQPHPAQPAAASPSKLSWRTDLPSALNDARSDNKFVLLDFTGSDWCPWCIKFDQDILSTDRFARYAGAHLILVKLGFPATRRKAPPSSRPTKRWHSDSTWTPSPLSSC